MKISEEKVIEYVVGHKSLLQRNRLEELFDTFSKVYRGSLADYLLTRTAMPLFSFMGKLPDYFMFNSEDITSLVIPGNIKQIGRNAFKDSAIETIKLEDGVEILGVGCFEGCKNLKAVDLADTITAIPNDCFKGCVNLTRVFLPDNIRTIGADAFLGCDNVEIVANYRAKDKIRAKKSDYEFLKQHLKFTHND